jgi:hypothetical protein
MRLGLNSAALGRIASAIRTARTDDIIPNRGGWDPEGAMLEPDVVLEWSKDDLVLASISGPGVAMWAAQDQAILGVPWEADGDDFAYAFIKETPNLVEHLKFQGYNVDDSLYEPPPIEIQAGRGKKAQAAEQQGLDWRDLQDLSVEVTAAVEQQDLRRLMEAVEDMTSLLLSHIQMPAETDVSGAFPREEADEGFIDRPASRNSR